MDYIKLRDKVSRMIKPGRFIHSLGVAGTAVYLARRFGLDEEKALAAGIYHDAYRYSTTPDSVSLLEGSGFVIEKEEREEPMLLHGALAALYFDRDAGESVSEDMKKAVRYHTLGSREMGKLGAAVYISDYMEPGRKHLSDEERTEILNLDTMEEMVGMIISRERAYRGDIAGITAELEEYIINGGEL